MFSLIKVNIDEGFLNLMTQDGTPKDDVKVPEGELGTQIQSDFDEGKDLLVTIVSAMGEEQVCLLIHLLLKYLSPALSSCPITSLIPCVLTFFSFKGHICQGGPKRLLIVSLHISWMQAPTETLFARSGCFL